MKPLAIIYYKSIQGRKQENLTSCFRAFYFLYFKDMKTTTIWLDNKIVQLKTKIGAFLHFLFK